MKCLQPLFAAILAAPLLTTTALAEETTVPDAVVDSCQQMATERCLVDTYNAVTRFAVNQMSALYNREGFDPEASLTLLDRNNLSLHWQACKPISSLSPLAPLLNQLSAPTYCLTAVEDFSAEFGGEYDRDTLAQWMAHLDALRDIHKDGDGIVPEVRTPSLPTNPTYDL